MRWNGVVCSQNSRNKGTEEECLGKDSTYINQIKVFNRDEPELLNLHTDLFLSILTAEVCPTLIWNISNLERQLIFWVPNVSSLAGRSLGSLAALDLLCPGKLICIWPKNISPSSAVVCGIKSANLHFFFCCNHLMKCVGSGI